MISFIEVLNEYDHSEIWLTISNLLKRYCSIHLHISQNILLISKCICGSLRQVSTFITLNIEFLIKVKNLVYNINKMLIIFCYVFGLHFIFKEIFLKNSNLLNVKYAFQCHNQYFSSKS